MSLGLQRARAVVLAGTIIGIGVNQILWFRTLDYLAERPMLEHNSHARTISGQKLIPRPTKAFENFFSPEQELEAIFKNLNSADAKVRVTRFVESLPVDLIPSVLNKLENRRSPQIRALLYYPLLQRLAKNNVQSALGYVEALSDAHQINEGRQAILQYWARYDQKGATQWAEALPSSRQREQAFRTMVRSLAENALDEALTVCDSASAKPFSQKLRGELAKALAESNPSAAATLAARIGIRDTVVLGEIAQRWAGEDFSSALGWATNLPPAHQSAVLLALARGTEVPSNALLSYAESMRPGDRKNALIEQLASQTAQWDTESAVKWVRSISDDRSRETAIRGIANEWGAYDPEGLAAVAKELQPGAAQADLLSTAAHHLAAKDISAAIQWTQDLPPGMGRNEAFRSVISTWASTEPKAAIEYVWAEPSGSSQRELLSLALREYANQSPAIALEWLEETPAGPAQTDGMRTVVSVWAESDPLGAAEYALGKNGAVRNALVQSVTSQWGKSDPDAAVAWIQSITDPGLQRDATARALPDLVRLQPESAAQVVTSLPSESQERLAPLLVTQWARNDPNGAREWVANLSDGPAKDAAETTLVQQLVRRSPSEAAALVATMPAGEKQSRNAMLVVGTWAQLDPRAAANWVGGFPNGSIREEAVKIVAQHWERYDRVAAELWRAGQDGSPKMKLIDQTIKR